MKIHTSMQTTRSCTAKNYLPICVAAFSLLLALLQGCRSSSKLLYPIEIESYYGYIDEEGTLVIPPRYSEAQGYASGLAPVQRSDGSLAYLNLKGEELAIADTYGPVQKADRFSDDMARVVVGQRVGYIDTNLRWVIEPRFAQAGRFSEGLALVLEQGKARYIDKKGLEVFSLEDVSAAGPIRAGFAYFVQNGLFGIVNRQGQIAKKPDFLFLAVADPESGLARALDSKTELYGFVDRDGSWVIPPRYPNARDFSDGFAAVFIRNTNRYGYIDTRGNMRIPDRYLAAGNFREGLAWVRTETGLRYINKDAVWISPLIFTYTNDFHQGLAAAGQGETRLYINAKGDITWPNP